MKFVYFTPAIIWLVISIVLLTLPGSDFPESKLFTLPYFDKYIHLAMFFLLTVLFSYPFSKVSLEFENITVLFNKVAVCAILYGIIMEFVQEDFTEGRSFDVVDIVFDTIGSILGLIAMRFYLNKKIGPNENRGRNQN